MLDRVCALSGIKRKEATFSTVTLEFTGTVGSVIPAGTKAADTNTPPREFVTQSQVIITDASGTVQTKAVATDEGPMTIPAGTVTTLLNPIPGITGVTNPSDGVSGQNRETDAELRLRREQSLSTQSRALVDSVYSALTAVDGVESVKVYENKEDTAGPEGIPPHSIYCVVAGGSDSDIADEIMKNKSLGCGLHGSTQVEWYDMQGFAHSVFFQRPTEINIYIAVSVTADNYGPAVEDDVKARIMAYVDDLRKQAADCPTGALGIGDDVQASTFYAPLTGIDQYSPILITVGTDAGAGNSVVTIGVDEISAFVEGNIIVTEYGAP